MSFPLISNTKSWFLNRLGRASALEEAGVDTVAGHAARLPLAWRKTSGQGVRVAVLDTGLATAHPQFAGRLKPGHTRDFTHSPRGVEDILGHGTYCAGLIGAPPDGGRPLGLAPAVELLIAKVIPDCGDPREEALAAAGQWALRAGAHILSMSFGGSAPLPALHRVLQEATGQGVLAFAPIAVGRGRRVVYPAAYPEVIAVGCAEVRRSRRARKDDPAEPDLVVPGHDLRSTALHGRYTVESGSSAATAYAAALGALALAGAGKIGRQGDLAEA